MKRLLISVCIPAMNRPKEIERGLKAIFASSCLPFEVIVSDDSDDKRALMVKEVVRRFPKVSYLKGPRKGLAANLNHCIKHTSGEFLVFLGDDNEVDVEYFKNMAEAWRKNQHRNQGRIIITGREIRNGEEVVPHNLTFMGYQAKEVEDDKWETIVVCSSLFPRELFRRARFDERLIYGLEEVDIAAQAKALGYEIIFCSSIVNYHNQSPTNRNINDKFVEASRIYFMLKYYSVYKRNPIKLLIYLVAGPLHLIGASVVRRRELSWSLWSVHYGLTNFLGMRRKRHHCVRRLIAREALE